jgi:hypothetical protein
MHALETMEPFLKKYQPEFPCYLLRILDFLVLPGDKIRYRSTRNAKKATIAIPESEYISSGVFPLVTTANTIGKMLINVFISLGIKTIQNYSGIYKGFVRIFLGI